MGRTDVKEKRVTMSLAVSIVDAILVIEREAEEESPMTVAAPLLVLL